MKKSKQKEEPLRNKYLRTVVRSQEIRAVMLRHGYAGDAADFHLVCRCSDLSDANATCYKAGMRFIAFSGVSAEEIAKSDSFREEETLWVAIDGLSDAMGFLPYTQVRKEMIATSNA